MSWSSELEHWHDMYDASVAAGLDRDLAVQLADSELEDAMAIKYSENTLISESSAKPMVIARLAAKDVYFFFSRRTTREIGATAFAAASLLGGGFSLGYTFYEGGQSDCRTYKTPAQLQMCERKWPIYDASIGSFLGVVGGAMISFIGINGYRELEERYKKKL